MTGVMSLLSDGSEECIFVMYYAPWCGRSVIARTEFDKAARYLEDEVSLHTASLLLILLLNIATVCWSKTIIKS